MGQSSFLIHPVNLQRRAQLGARAAMMAFLTVGAWPAFGQFSIRQIADDAYINRSPVISTTGLIAWEGMRLGPDASDSSEIFIYTGGVTRALTEGVVGPNAANSRPQVFENRLVWMAKPPSPVRDQITWTLVDPPWDEDHPEEDSRWVLAPGADNEPESQIFVRPAVGENGAELETNRWDRLPRRLPSGRSEIMLWEGNDIRRITADGRNDFGPALGADLIAWQKARGWPFGWEIMVLAGDQRMQMTTNYFYDMGTHVDGQQVVWYGWTGRSYNIFLYDHDAGTTVQITDTDYDNKSPRIADGIIVWEGYAGINADIFMWADGEIRQLSNNFGEDSRPRIWNGEVVWQSFDGDFFQIMHFDGNEVHELTNTRYDNINPDIRDGLIVWQGYVDNFESEIFVWNGGPDAIRLTDNEYEDQRPRTAAGKVVWQADTESGSKIFLAEPVSP